MKRYSIEIMSACDGVTGSQTLLVIHRGDESKKILIDCGWNFELDQKDQKIITKNPDTVILTHSHTDHVACLPELCKTFDGIIYASKDTRNLLGLSLDDTLTIQRGNAKMQGTSPLYDEADINKATSQVKSIDTNKRVKIEEDIYLTLISNSHIPGACCAFIEVEVPKYLQSDEYEIPNMNFFFTGDLKTKDNPFLEDTVIPKEILEKPMYVITESTYGEENRERIKVFEKNIQKALTEKKKIIIPVLSLGRAQQILLVLKNMQENEKIQLDIPIFVDGKLLFKYNNKFRSQLDILEKNFEPHGLNYVTKDNREYVKKMKGSYIVVSSSGNASFGPSNDYVLSEIDNPNALIHFTSFLPKETLGRKLIETCKGDVIELSGMQKTIAADVKTTSEYSSHDEKNDLIDFIKSFKDLRGVLVTHGEEAARENIINILEEELNKIEVLNLSSKKFIRIDKMKGGKMKEINSKFDLETLKERKNEKTRERRICKFNISFQKRRARI